MTALAGVVARFDALGSDTERSFRFDDPIELLVAHRPSEVAEVLRRVDAATGAGEHAAGYLAYDAAPAMDRALVVREGKAALPLACFGIFRERRPIEPLEGLDACAPPYRLGEPVPSMGPEEYAAAVGRILDWIAAGDTYQVNLTFALQAAFSGSTDAFYRDLCRAQRSGYCAHLRFGSVEILSASPELFFRRTGDRVEMRPMKGTRPRGRWSEEDDQLAASLQSSVKDRAENLMIVDLLRNDLGRVAAYGSVRVPSLYDIERYPTVLQMTSNVEARVPAGTTNADLFHGLFPSGSVTGAPKVRTSEIIKELEGLPRGVYTGAIGFAGPDEAVFNVAIRTAVVDRATDRVVVGVGSGITADSLWQDEYQECLGKGGFLRHRWEPFRLLESLRLEVPGGYPHADRHLERMSASARYFGFPFAPAEARRALEDLARTRPPGVYKVRLLASESGTFELGVEQIHDAARPPRIRLARHPVDGTNPFLFHKTTRRAVYEQALAGELGVDDVLLHNERGEITESTRANVVLQIGDVRLTPPLSSGLLPGVERSAALAEGRVREAVLRIEDLAHARKIFLLNAVRGWREAVLLPV